MRAFKKVNFAHNVFLILVSLHKACKANRFALEMEMQMQTQEYKENKWM